MGSQIEKLVVEGERPPLQNRVGTSTMSECLTSDICQVNIIEYQVKCLLMPDHICIVSNHAKLKFSSHRHNVSPAADT